MTREKTSEVSAWEEAFPIRRNSYVGKILVNVVCESMPQITSAHAMIQKGKMRLVFVAETFSQSNCYSMSTQIREIGKALNFKRQTDTLLPEVCVVTMDQLADRGLKIKSTLWKRQD